MHTLIMGDFVNLWDWRRHKRLSRLAFDARNTRQGSSTGALSVASGTFQPASTAN